MRRTLKRLAVLSAGAAVLFCGLSCADTKAASGGWSRLKGLPYLVVIDRETCADAELRSRLDLYFKNVNKLFSFAPVIIEVDPLARANPGKNIWAVRDLIKQQYERKHVAGVILIGKIPFMTWRQAAGSHWINIGTEDFCYGDLDAEFLDRETRHGTVNSDLASLARLNAPDNHDNELVPGKESTPDGQFETYLRGKNEGPEIWVSRIFARSNAQYFAYFDKVNTYYKDIITRLAADKKAEVMPFTNVFYTGHPDYVPSAGSDKYKTLNNFNRSLPGSQFVVVGENVGGTVPELFAGLNSRPYFFGEIDGHADPYYHFFKKSHYSVDDVLSKIEPGRGALIQALWGCHGGDIAGIKDGYVNLTLAYPLNRGITQAAYGCSWTGGLEELEKDILAHMGNGDYLGLAFQKAQKRLYSKSYMEKFFANEARHNPHFFLPANGSPVEKLDALMTKLLRGHNLTGNPFLKVVYKNP